MGVTGDGVPKFDFGDGTNYMRFNGTTVYLAGDGTGLTKIQGGSIVTTSLSAISANLGNITAGQIVVGTTNKLWLNENGDGDFHVGGSVKASAPFQVSQAGVLNATGAVIDGTITAQGGAINGELIITATGGMVTGKSSGVEQWRLAKGGLSIRVLNAAGVPIKFLDGSDNLVGHITFGWDSVNLVSSCQYHTEPLDAAGTSVVYVQAQSGATLGTTQARVEMQAYADMGLVLAEVKSTVTDQVVEVLTVSHHTSGTAAAGFGARVSWAGEVSTGGTRYTMAHLDASWAVATTSSRRGLLTLNAKYITTSQEGMRVEGYSTGVRLGFFGAAAVSKAAHIADATDAASVITRANAIIAALEGYGLLATS